MTQRPRFPVPPQPPAEPPTAPQDDTAADRSTQLDKLIRRALTALGPPHDGAAELQNIAFAKRIVAVLLAFRIISLARQQNENDEKTQLNNGHSD